VLSANAGAALPPPALTTQQALAVVRVAALTFRGAVKTAAAAAAAAAPPGSMSLEASCEPRPCTLATRALWRAVIGATLTLVRLQRVLSVQASSAVLPQFARDDQADTSADDVAIGAALLAVGVFVCLCVSGFFRETQRVKIFPGFGALGARTGGFEHIAVCVFRRPVFAESELGQKQVAALLASHFVQLDQPFVLATDRR
jgi:hypothetical protein